jgi:hypothetical protein
MRKLLARFDAIATGQTDVDFAPTRSVEINLLSDTAQNMLRNIDRLQRETLAQQTLLTREQFKVLQHQINPHLVNNTLQSIKALALSQDTAAISRTTTLLGRILSYSVYNPLDMVPLAEELNYIENCIALQRLRYPGIVCGIDCGAEAGAARARKALPLALCIRRVERRRGPDAAPRAGARDAPSQLPGSVVRGGADHAGGDDGVRALRPGRVHAGRQGVRYPPAILVRGNFLQQEDLP